MRTVEKTILGSGLTVATRKHPGAESVGVCVGVARGSVDDPARIAGASHFLEHMLFRGTRRRTWKDIEEDVEGVGGRINGATGYEDTTYWVWIHGNHLGVALDVLSDIIQNSVIAPRKLAVERGTVLREVEMYLDDPVDLARDLFPSALYARHPAGRFVCGTKRSVSRIARGDLVKMYKREYVPGNAVVAVAGDVKHAGVVQRGAAAFRGWTGGPPPKERAVAREPQKRREVVRPRAGSLQTQLIMGFKVPPFEDSAGEYALEVLAKVLEGRVKEEVRQKRGLAYNPDANHYSYGTFGFIEASASVSPASLGAAKEIISDEFGRLRDGEMTAAEVKHARAYVRNHFLLENEATASSAVNMAEYHALFGDAALTDAYPGRVGAVTVGDVRAAAGYLDPDNYSALILGPKRGPRAGK